MPVVLYVRYLKSAHCLDSGEAAALTLNGAVTLVVPSSYGLTFLPGVSPLSLQRVNDKVNMAAQAPTEALKELKGTPP